MPLWFWKGSCWIYRWLGGSTDILAIVNLLIYEHRCLSIHLCLWFLSSDGGAICSAHTPVGSARGVQAGVLHLGSCRGLGVHWSVSFMACRGVAMGGGRARVSGICELDTCGARVHRICRVSMMAVLIHAWFLQRGKMLGCLQTDLWEAWWTSCAVIATAGVRGSLCARRPGALGKLLLAHSLSGRGGSFQPGIPSWCWALATRGWMVQAGWSGSSWLWWVVLGFFVAEVSYTGCRSPPGAACVHGYLPVCWCLGRDRGCSLLPYLWATSVSRIPNPSASTGLRFEGFSLATMMVKPYVHLFRSRYQITIIWSVH